MSFLSFKDVINQEFETIEEPWNYYKLEDDTVLKSKFILISIGFSKSLDDVEKEYNETEEPVEMAFGIQSRNVVGAIPPDNLVLQPNITGEYSEHIVHKDVNIEEAREKWNEYRLASGVNIKIKNSIVNVDRTDRSDAMGIPIYLVNQVGDVKITLPEKYKGKLKLINVGRG